MQIQQENQFDYTPKINKKSEQMVYQKLVANAGREEENIESSSFLEDGSISMLQRDKFSELYGDAIKRKQRQDKAKSIQFDQDCTFQPKLISKGQSKVQ